MISPASVAAGLAIALFVAPPLTAPFERRFLGSGPSTPGKLAYYGFTILLSCALSAIAVWIFGVERLGHLLSPGEAWVPVAFVARPLVVAFRWVWEAWPPLASIAGLVVVALLAAYVLLGLMPLFQSLRGARWRRAYAKAFRRRAVGFAGILPDTAAERLGFVLLGLNAGVCEEVLYRGFLIRYLRDGAPGLPLVLALAAASLAFGLLHAYQGIPGILETGVGGVAFGLLFLLTGSLIPAIVVHALFDLQVAYVLRPVPDEAGQGPLSAPAPN